MRALASVPIPLRRSRWHCAAQRSAKRRDPLEATCARLARVQQILASTRLKDADNTGVGAGRVMNM